MVEHKSSKFIERVRFPSTLMLQYYFISITSVISLLTIILLDNFHSNFFTSNLFLIMVMFLTYYWVISIFLFLFKKHEYSSYTTVIQRFWKRTLSLFWSLELFLFGIYLYLILLNAKEVSWLFDHQSLYQGAHIKPVFLQTSFILVLSILVTYYITLKNSTHSMLTKQVVMLILFTVIYVVLRVEFTQLFTTNSQRSAISWVFNDNLLAWSSESNIQKYRTNQHYMFLLVILKFWHTVFIAIFYLISLAFLLNKKNSYLGLFSSNRQNLFFLYGFFYISVYPYFSYILSYNYQDIYFWFFI